MTLEELGAQAGGTLEHRLLPEDINLRINVQCFQSVGCIAQHTHMGGAPIGAGRHDPPLLKAKGTRGT